MPRGPKVGTLKKSTGLAAARAPSASRWHDNGRVTWTTARASNYRDRRILGACVRPLTIKRTLVCPATNRTRRAADETIPTLTRRFDTLGIHSTEESRRTCREMLFTSPGAAEFISGVIMYDETIRQKGSGGPPLVEALTAQGIIPGIKVDTGAKPLAGFPGGTITEGLDGLRDRLAEYRAMGARFAKWRAVIHVTETLPSSACVSANAYALGRYAALCQEQELVPIVEPEVLMDGSHTIERCEEVTGNVLHAVFHALFAHSVVLEGMLLKPNMVVAGKECGFQASVPEVATATLRCLRRHVGIRPFLGCAPTKRRSTSSANRHEKNFEEICSRSPTRSVKVGGGASRHPVGPPVFTPSPYRSRPGHCKNSTASKSNTRFPIGMIFKSLKPPLVASRSPPVGDRRDRTTL